MGQNSGAGGLVRPWHLQHLGSLAVSAPGVLIMESGAVEALGAGSVGALSLYDDAQEAAMAALVRDIRSFSDTRLGMQIVHCGRKIPESDLPGIRDELGLAKMDIYGPSPVGFGAGHPVPLELGAGDLRRLVGAFAASAERVLRCGFDLLEIHAAHGYLLHEFYSSLSNLRTDGYGGSLANRLRFPLEVAEAVRAVWPRDRALGIRVNCLDYVSGDVTVDEAIALGRELRGLGYDYVCVTSGSIVGRGQMPAPKPGYLVPVARRMREEAGIPVMVVGMIGDPRQADAIIAEGHADILGIARAFIDDPRWVWHAAERLGVKVTYPASYERAHAALWPGMPLARSIFAANDG
jgi:NADPH2 dehydrogenase